MSDEILTPPPNILAQSEQVLQQGVKVLQFRDKNSSDEEVKALCIQLQALCKKYNALFVVNDRVDLAAEINAEGLHIGAEDLDLPIARKKVGKDCIIGVSCYGDLSLARKAVKNSADYVAFGAVFPSPTKPSSFKIDPKVVRLAKKELHVPVCVIGGINVENIQEVQKYQADMFAIVSAIFKGDIQENIKMLNSKLNA